MPPSSLDLRLLGLAPGDVRVRIVASAAALGLPIALAAAMATDVGGVTATRLGGALVVAWQSFVLGVSLLRSGP